MGEEKAEKGKGKDERESKEGKAGVEEVIVD